MKAKILSALIGAALATVLNQAWFSVGASDRSPERVDRIEKEQLDAPMIHAPYSERGPQWSRFL